MFNRNFARPGSSMSLCGASARFDVKASLTEDKLRDMAPSIFAIDAHDSRSERFRPIPTIEIVRGLASEGFLPVMATQARTRDESKVDFTKHMIRFRRMDEETKYTVGDTVCELVLQNANDGTSAYALMAGLFKIQCLNSLVSQTSTLDSVKIRHSGDAMANVIEGSYRVIGEAQKTLAAPREWSRVDLSNGEREAFSEAAHVLRFGDADGNVTTAIQPNQLLNVRRREDAGCDLWSTFNVVQENAIRGGMTAMGRDANGRRRRTTARAVNGIDQDIRLNKALWVLTSRMAELRGAPALHVA